MKKEIKSIPFWPALSITLLFAFLNLSFTILLILKINFFIYCTIIISNLALTTVYLFLELSGFRKILWSKWNSLPTIIHKFICLICAFWLAFLICKALIPTMKKAYEEN